MSSHFIVPIAFGASRRSMWTTSSCRRSWARSRRAQLSHSIARQAVWGQNGAKICSICRMDCISMEITIMWRMLVSFNCKKTRTSLSHTDNARLQHSIKCFDSTWKTRQRSPSWCSAIHFSPAGASSSASQRRSCRWRMATFLSLTVIAIRELSSSTSRVRWFCSGARARSVALRCLATFLRAHLLYHTRWHWCTRMIRNGFALLTVKMEEFNGKFFFYCSSETQRW